jgi:tetratricopeptide (TPR) repeat protein
MEIDKGIADIIYGEVYFGIGEIERSLSYFREAGISEGLMGYIGRYREGRVEAYRGNFEKAAMIYEKLLVDTVNDSIIREWSSIQEFLGKLLTGIRRALE